MRWRTATFLLVVAVLISILSLPFFWAYPDDFGLHQFIVADKIITHHPLDILTIWKTIRSRYSFGLNRLLLKSNRSVNYKDPKQFFSYLFSRFPTYAVVYPTETYYYYTTTMQDGRILSGNIRLLDAQSGILHIGYFDKTDPHSPDSESWTVDIGSRDGVSITTNGPFAYDVSYQNKTIHFVLSDFIAEPPKKLRMLPEEKFVSQVLDDSGIRFFLLFNQKTNSFYYIANEEHGIDEQLREIKSNYYLGLDSQFVYYYDRNENRKLLVGVSKHSIYLNDYYDGPFDQVPPRLDDKSMLIAAYPYVVYRGGIDAHGNFNNIPGERVAISPYYDYESIPELLSYLSRCKDGDKSIFWSCLTYEWKKDFKPSPKQIKGLY